MEKIKHIALVAHDTSKKELIEWVTKHWKELLEHKLICTGTTGKLVEEALLSKIKDAGLTQKPEIIRLKSGPLGGDQQLGAMISDGLIDIVLFLWDPMQPQPHDVDVKALLRLIVLYNVVAANSISTADFIISSPLFRQPYDTAARDYSDYINRKV